MQATLNFISLNVGGEDGAWNALPYFTHTTETEEPPPLVCSKTVGSDSGSPTDDDEEA